MKQKTKRLGLLAFGAAYQLEPIFFYLLLYAVASLPFYFSSLNFLGPLLLGWT